MPNETMNGKDVYLRFNGGRVQCFRVWDIDRFIASQVAQGRAAPLKEDRYEVTTD